MKKVLLLALASAMIGCGKADETAETTTTTTTNTEISTPAPDPNAATQTTPGTSAPMPGATPSQPSPTTAPTGGPSVTAPTVSTMPQPNNQRSSLIVTNNTMILSPAKMEESSVIELSCGCPFELRVEGFSGATNAIKYEKFDAKTAQTHKEGLRFKAVPNAPKGTHVAKLAFLSTGSKGDYRDTITVTYKL